MYFGAWRKLLGPTPDKAGRHPDPLPPPGDERNQSAGIRPNLAQRLADLEKDQLRLARQVENEVAGRIALLYDVQEIHEARLTRLGVRMDEICCTVRFLVARVSAVERLAK